ncbi:hypothetical protein NDU88_005558 [Pleurodeles waltl]|uniref:Uncharacterized protein n=1 Tax=Pleurodeles waltl TaxID=8319 RepID=A0AAV7TVP7_PLEWA|nr:hypothetical protein NDU88_005558 [Pleurodeles waltl]
MVFTSVHNEGLYLALTREEKRRIKPKGKKKKEERKDTTNRDEIHESDSDNDFIIVVPGGGVLGVSDGEVDYAVGRPGEFCDVAESDSITEEEEGVESVSGLVCGYVDWLGEAYVAQLLEEGGGVDIVWVVDVEIEVIE